MGEGESGRGWGKVLPLGIPLGDIILSTLKRHLLSITALKSMVKDKCGLSGCLLLWTLCMSYNENYDVRQPSAAH